MDDLRSDTFSYEELLKILDPRYNAPVHSRYRDKVLRCDRIFITTVEHPREFVSRYKLSANDSAEQFYRRLDEVWEVTAAAVRAEKYDLKHKSFLPMFTTENPVKSYLCGMDMDLHTRVSSMNIFRQIEADCKPQFEIEGFFQPDMCNEETVTGNQTEDLPF